MKKNKNLKILTLGQTNPTHESNPYLPFWVGNNSLFFFVFLISFPIGVNQISVKRF